jgi:hypothetical protein
MTVHRVRIGSIKLKPQYVRAHHLGPVTKPQAIEKIKTTAKLMGLDTPRIDPEAAFKRAVEKGLFRGLGVTAS